MFQHAIRRRFRMFVVMAVVGLLLAAPGRAEAPTVAEAEEFMTQAEEQLLGLWVNSERASWVQSNFITEDTEAIAAAAQTELIGATMELAAAAARYNDLDLGPELRRKLLLLKTSLPLAAPADRALQAELSGIMTRMESLYGKGEYCPEGGECFDLTKLSRTLAESRDADLMLDLWRGWRTISLPMKPMYERFVELGNAGARDLGFADLGELWRSGYDMDPDLFRDL